MTVLKQQEASTTGARGSQVLESHGTMGWNGLDCELNYQFLILRLHASSGVGLYYC